MSELTMADLRAYDRPVARLLLHIVNDCGVRHRDQDGGHLLLYPPDGTSRPFKVAASRPGPKSVLFLEKFMRDYSITPVEKDKPVLTAPKRRSEATVSTHPKKASEFVKTEVAKIPATPVEVRAAEAAKAVEAVETDPEWVAVDERWETNGTLYRCLVCTSEGKEFVTENLRARGGHTRAQHTDTTALYSPEARAQAGETNRVNRLKAKVADLAEALLELADVPDQTKRVKELEAQVASYKSRAEEAEARLALMREALKA